MLISKRFSLLPYINLIHIICSIDKSESLRDIDVDVWELARKHEEIPNFQRIYAVVICDKLKEAILSKYKNLGLNVDYYINYDEPHFFVNHSEIYSLEDLKRIIGDVDSDDKNEWQPDYILEFSQNDTLGIKIFNTTTVEYSYGHEGKYKNIQKTKILKGCFDENGKLLSKKLSSNVDAELYFKINDVDAVFRINSFKRV